MSKGLGARQRAILAKLAEHRDNPPDYTPQRFARLPNGRLGMQDIPAHEWSEHMHDMVRQRREWTTVQQLAHPGTASDIESTRRAVHKLETAGLIETRTITWYGPHRLGARLKT
jgi:hypothetical protein